MNSSMEKSFQKLEDDQSESRLMKLPAELRLKVLRNLLRDKDDFPPRMFTMIDEPEKYCLSAQTLRLCQKWYVEGVSVLYDENALFLRIEAERNRMKLKTIGTTVRFLYDGLHNIKSLDEELSKPIVPEGNGGERQQLLRKNLMWLSDNLYMLTRFRQIWVHIVYDGSDYLYTACQLIKDFLIGKDVVMSVGTNWYGVASPILSSILTGLRCRTFQLIYPNKSEYRGLTDLEISVSGGDATHLPDYYWPDLDAEKLTSIITGDSQVIDLHHECSEWLSAVDRAIGLVAEHTTLTKLYFLHPVNPSSALQDAVMRSAQPDFYLHVAAFVEQVRRSIQRSVIMLRWGLLLRIDAQYLLIEVQGPKAGEARRNIENLETEKKDLSDKEAAFLAALDDIEARLPQRQ